MQRKVTKGKGNLVPFYVIKTKIVRQFDTQKEGRTSVEEKQEGILVRTVGGHGKKIVCN